MYESHLAGVVTTVMKVFSKFYSEYLLIPRPLRGLLFLWGWIVLFVVAGIKFNWFYFLQ